MAHSLAEPRVLLLLRIIGGIEKTKTPDRWKVQKTTFFAETKMQEEGIGGLNYEFLKDRDGPLATGIYQDIEFLINAGFVNSDFDPKLTPEGKRLLSSIGELYEMNKEVVAPVDETLTFVSDKTSKELRDMTHQMEVEVSGKAYKIHDLPPYYSILQPMPSAFEKKKFKMPVGWRHTLEILGSKESRESLKATVECSAPCSFIPLERILE